MNTLILSSSLSKNSRSFILCEAVAKQLSSKNIKCTIVDSRKIPILSTHLGHNSEMKRLSIQIKEAEKYIDELFTNSLNTPFVVMVG